MSWCKNSTIFENFPTHVCVLISFKQSRTESDRRVQFCSYICKSDRVLSVFKQCRAWLYWFNRLSTELSAVFQFYMIFCSRMLEGNQFRAILRECFLNCQIAIQPL